MKLRFRDGRTNGRTDEDIEALADAMRALKNRQLKSLNYQISVLHNFDVGKVSQIHKTFLIDQQLFCWRHFSKTEVVQNTDLNILAL